MTIDLLDQAAWVSNNVHTCTLVFMKITNYSLNCIGDQTNLQMYMLRHQGIVASVSKGFKIINGYWYYNYIKVNFDFMYFMNSSRIECRTMLYKFWGSLQCWRYIPEPAVLCFWLLRARSESLLLPNGWSNSRHLSWSHSLHRHTDHHHRLL